MFAGAVVQDIPGHGRGVLASQAIRPGTAVLTEVPLALVPRGSCDPAEPAVCSGCGQVVAGAHAMRCGGCKVVAYCSKDCQKADWKLHKKECACMRGVDASSGERVFGPGRLPVPQARLLARLTWLRKTDPAALAMFDKLWPGDAAQQAKTAGCVGQFFRFMDVGGALEDIAPCAAVATASGDKSVRFQPDHAQVVSKVNADAYRIELNDAGTEHIACVFPWFAFLNHSCEPNCKWQIEAGAMKVTAIKRIEPGNELFISYMDDPTVHPKVRHGQLRRCYGFDCDCRLCAAVLGTPEDGTTAMQCAHCDAGTATWFPGIKPEQVTCSSCHAAVAPSVLDALNNCVLFQSLQEVDVGVSGAEARALLATYKQSAAPVLQSLKPSHCLYAFVLRRLIAAARAAGAAADVRNYSDMLGKK